MPRLRRSRLGSRFRRADRRHIRCVQLDSLVQSTPVCSCVVQCSWTVSCIGQSSCTLDCGVQCTPARGRCVDPGAQGCLYSSRRRPDRAKTEVGNRPREAPRDRVRGLFISIYRRPAYRATRRGCARRTAHERAAPRNDRGRRGVATRGRTDRAFAGRGGVRRRIRALTRYAGAAAVPGGAPTGRTRPRRAPRRVKREAGCVGSGPGGYKKKNKTPDALCTLWAGPTLTRRVPY